MRPLASSFGLLLLLLDDVDETNDVILEDVVLTPSATTNGIARLLWCWEIKVGDDDRTMATLRH